MDLLSYGFMQNAFMAGAIIALTLPFLGIFLVSRRYALMADSLAHVSLVGVGAAMLLGISPLYMALPVSILAAVFLEWLQLNRKLSGEVGLAILTSGGLAIAIVLAGLSRNSSASFNSYLFGSIATTTRGDIITLAIVGLIITYFLISRYRTLLHIVYSPSSALISGAKVQLVQYTLTAMTAAITVLSLRIVGGLLIGSLIVIPVIAASKIARSFSATLKISIIFSLASVYVGLIVSYYTGIAAGGAITICAIVTLLLSVAVSRR